MILIQKRSRMIFRSSIINIVTDRVLGFRAFLHFLASLPPWFFLQPSGLCMRLQKNDGFIKLLSWSQKRGHFSRAGRFFETRCDMSVVLNKAMLLWACCCFCCCWLISNDHQIRTDRKKTALCLFKTTIIFESFNGPVNSPNKNE